MTSRDDELSKCYGNEGDSETTESEKLQMVNLVRQWIENEAEFYGRTDEKFILLFLRGCKFDLTKTEKKVKAYYESRKQLPKWWANRDLTDDNLQSLIQRKVTTALMDKEIDQPTVVIYPLARIGPNLGNFDHYLKLHGIILDIAIRRQNCQMNGFVWIVDVRNYPFWFATRLLSPVFAKNLIKSFYLSIPVRIKKVVILNTPPIAYAFYRLVQPFLPKKIQQRIVPLGSDWSKLYDHVPRKLLPEEYGGTAGPMAEHDDAFIKEILEFNDYLVDDNKYGFQ